MYYEQFFRNILFFVYSLDFKKYTVSFEIQLNSIFSVIGLWEISDAFFSA